MTITRRTSRLAAGLGIASGAVLLLAGPAAADTSQAQATAASVQLLGSPVVSTGQVAATNAGPGGPGEIKTGSNSTSILPGQTLLTAGVLAQDAAAAANGPGGRVPRAARSEACAGALGQGGAIQIGPAGGCVPTVGTPGGVSVNLGAGLASLGADAIFAQCNASSTGRPRGSATLANANIFVLGIPLPITLGVAPAPNQGVNVPGIASIILNEQVFTPGPGPTTGGRITVNALRISLLSIGGAPAADIIVGSVTCGPNAIAPDISIFSGPALPAAAAGAAIVGVVYFRRRRQAA